MKKLMPMITILLTGAFSFAQGSYQPTQIEVLPASELSITGDTNINTFECNFNASYTKEAQKIFYSHNKSQINFNGAILKLNTEGFDCGSKAINKDFHALIQSEKHPEILLEVNKVKIQSPSKGLANVCITIAGIQKFYDVPVQIKNDEVAHFQGVLGLDINDFGLEPPKKLFGIIQVKDEIEINFDLKVRK